MYLKSKMYTVDKKLYLAHVSSENREDDRWNNGASTLYMKHFNCLKRAYIPITVLSSNRLWQFIRVLKDVPSLSGRPSAFVYFLACINSRLEEN